MVICGSDAAGSSLFISTDGSRWQDVSGPWSGRQIVGYGTGSYAFGQGACILSAVDGFHTGIPAQFQFTTGTSGRETVITGYEGPGGAVSIPGTLYGMPVTGIGDRAFFYCTGMTSVTIPEGVTKIGDGSF